MAARIAGRGLDVGVQVLRSTKLLATASRDGTRAASDVRRGVEAVGVEETLDVVFHGETQRMAQGETAQGCLSSWTLLANDGPGAWRL
jgi:hypothetical protein